MNYERLLCYVRLLTITMNHNGLAGVRALENSQSMPVLQCTAQSQRKRRTENLQIHDYRAEN